MATTSVLRALDCSLMLVVKLPPNIFSIILDLSQIKQALPLSKLHMAFAATRYWILIGNYSLDVFYNLNP